MKLFGIEVSTIEKVQAFYADELNRYSTPSAKRARMTKDINAYKVWINDIREALDIAQGWFLGDKYSPIHLRHFERELQQMEYIREAIQ